MAAQNFSTDGVEGAKPWHAFGHLAEQMPDALFHFTRGFIGKRHGQNLRRIGRASSNNMRDARGQHAGFAGAGAREHEHRAVDDFDRAALLGV